MQGKGVKRHNGYVVSSGETVKRGMAVRSPWADGNGGENLNIAVVAKIENLESQISLGSNQKHVRRLLHVVHPQV